MTNDTRPREWTLVNMFNNWDVVKPWPGTYVGALGSKIKVVELRVYEAAIKRAEAAERERDKLIKLLSGEEVELKCKNPGYHATVKFDVAQNPSESESAGIRKK